jgi:FimV-like protein
MLKSSEAVVPGALRRTMPGVRGGLMALLIASASMLYPAMASALGLGDITLHSALNQPLDADIDLVETGGLNEEDVIAKLATPEAFTRAGVERVFFLNDLRFTPIIHGNHGVIHVVSSKPVTEPFLNFLVQLSRPNGDLLHEYTLLLDPATTPAGRAALQGRNRESITQTGGSRMPVAPPPAVQSKHYVVVAGDNLGSIARRLHGTDSKMSADELATGIKALNPQAFPAGNTKELKVGQNLLLPDAAVLPSVAPVTPTAAASVASGATAPANAASPTTPAAAPTSAQQLAGATVENQQLNHEVDDLKGQLSGKDKEIVTLETQLAELKSAPAQPVAVAPVTPVAPTPVATPVPAPVATPAPVVLPAPAPVVDDSFISQPILLGALLILLLLLGLVYSMRRKRQKELDDDDYDEPMPDDIGPTPVILDVPGVSAPRTVAPVVAPVVAPIRPQAPAAQRPASAPPDALDGVNIYIAYGRFTEALGILRDALDKQPERMDIRAKILELLAEQGDASGFAAQEQNFIEQGLDPEKVAEIRGRYPLLKKAEPPAPTASVAPVVAAVAAAAVTAAVVKPTLAKAPPAPAEDEFQLNLDDLSMDADWDLVDPFDTPRSRKQETVQPEEEDPGFASNLTQLPEVFEMQEEQFLSDFSEPEDDFSEPEVIPEPIVQADSDALDDDFLDGFMDDTTDFDLLDLDEAPLSKLNEAQVLIDDGDIESARLILQELIENGDDAHQQAAFEMLKGLD